MQLLTFVCCLDHEKHLAAKKKTWKLYRLSFVPWMLQLALALMSSLFTVLLRSKLHYDVLNDRLLCVLYNQYKRSRNNTSFWCLWYSVADPAPRGAYRAVLPPNENYAPPSEDCAPKKLTGSGLLECKSRPKLVFFVDWHRISWHFWDEELFFFFLEITHFRPEKPLEFLISAGKSLANL